MNKYIKFLEKATAKTNPSNLKNEKESEEAPDQKNEVESLNI